MAKLRYKVCVKQEGKDKTYWKQIGVVLQGDKGFSLKLEAVPVAWDGWAQMFEPDKDEPKKPEPAEDIPF